MKDYNSLITNKDGNKLRILMVGKHTCIRVIRYAEVLKVLGYSVDLLTNKISYGTDVFDKIGFWHDEKQFKSYLYALKDKYDICHVHNEPDEIVSWSKEVLEDTVVIYDCHDSDLIRRGYIPIQERRAYNSADAVIYVSEPIRKICSEIHNLDIPTMVMYNYPTQSMIDNTEVDFDNAHTKKRTLVYEGGINPVGDSPEIKEMNRIFKYRNLFPLFQELIYMGNEVHAFPGNQDAFITGQTTGVILYPPTIFNKLLQEMTKYKYNLLIFNNEDGKQEQVLYTTPNKLWDGLAAGLPSIACYCSETEKYVKKHDLGWTFNNIKDIKDCSELEIGYRNKIKSVKKKRMELIFNRQIVLLENFYAKLLGVDGKSMPKDIEDQLVFEYGEKDVKSLLKEVI